MPSSGHTAQLGLWREIVSKRHPETEPVDQHLGFIRKRFDELDSGGFVWSKKSILDIFLQIGISDSPRGPISSVRRKLKSPAYQQFELPSDEVEKAIQDKELKTASRPRGLVDLPNEVIENIIKILDCMAQFEAKDVGEKKESAMVNICGLDEEEGYWTYLHRNPPVLNSIQAFALISREIHQLCRPWLWRKLEFPSSLPAPMDLWTEDILIRQGFYVRALSISLSSNCSKPPGEYNEYPPLYDNLVCKESHDDIEEQISPENVRALLDRCPNLSTLKISYECAEDNEDEGGTTAFLLDLIPLLTSLKHLRKFTLNDVHDQITLNDFPLKLVCALPLLESLTWRGLSDQRNLGDGSFGFNLSKLKFLSQLHLARVDNVDESWCLHDWPKTITDLSFWDCGGVSPSSAHRIVHHIAPCVTKLQLRSSNIFGHDTWAIDSNWYPQLRFSLPLLADLEICARSTQSLNSFRDCNSISCLRWPFWSSDHCRSLKSTLLQGPWPQLKKVVSKRQLWHELPNYDFQPEVLEDILISLEEHCAQANIKAIIDRPYPPARR
ncbi:uncharacterized protein MELLADRAFT_58290 [Melampsora larici-populina 98AG31]|uniref:F-box domain-containing protein n=1 Tax=Melampsora larici-populina (strain 98AG31 / pathotype 3-4-7) TaxID=747676 RepID=F4R302_MELLP|nr:uncharacterized protein MELLADRAFT_58290 [Melampsora larici-populina 98AG31]EGG12541.1 hypothetical protein MELLADRAFT_58290 [Melampsora larici-populina 98AG31]